jgi:hypothetical protein
MELIKKTTGNNFIDKVGHPIKFEALTYGLAGNIFSLKSMPVKTFLYTGTANVSGKGVHILESKNENYLVDSNELYKLFKLIKSA